MQSQLVQAPTLPPTSPMSLAPAEAVTQRQPGLSVVIPAYNDLKHLLPCLRSLVQTGAEAGNTGRLEILVQDDCSPDFYLAEVLGPPVKVERNAVNLGFGGNCNAGALRAQGEILLFLNQDTKARPGWFAPLMAAFDDPRVGIVGPKLVFMDRAHESKDSIASCGGWYDAGRGPYHRYLGWDAADWRVNVRERVSWTTGAALAVRRGLFYAVGGFDLRFIRGYFEDCALSEAVKANGFDILYEPASVFEHAVGTTGGVPPETFRANSLLFHRLWDSYITPDTPGAVFVNY